MEFETLFKLFDEKHVDIDGTSFYFKDDPQEIEHFIGYQPQYALPYWIEYGDIEGGCEFMTAREMFEAPVFNGRSLKDRWEDVVLISIGAVDIDEWSIDFCQPNKNQKTHSRWTPPKNYKHFFLASSDDEFKAAHPVGYFFLVLFGIIALFLPAVLFCVVVGYYCGWENGWIMLGCVGGFVFGIGLFNYVAIIIKQFLGHWVSIISFLVGGLLMYVSWIICR
ncbi:MAG: hypothetical protein IJS78_02970 [Clostridia bacterium]|nr:hypothetical protein [Clostridia bacterium]